MTGKVKGRGTSKWNGVRGIRLALLDSSDGYAKESVGILMRDEWLEKLFANM